MPKRVDGATKRARIDANENERMRELARDLGFKREQDPDDPTRVIHRLVF